MKPSDSLFALTNHLVYWLLDRHPISRIATHPSNIARDYMIPFVEGKSATPATALTSIFERAPDYVVSAGIPSYLADTVLEDLLRAELRQNYEQVFSVEKSVVYRRVEKSHG